MSGPANLEIACRILCEKRNRITGFQAGVAKCVRYLVRPLIQLFEGYGFSGGSHDIGGLVRMGLRVVAGMHVFLLISAALLVSALDGLEAFLAGHSHSSTGNVASAGFIRESLVFRVSRDFPADRPV